MEKNSPPKDIRHQLKEFEEGNDPKQSRGEEKEIFLGKGDLSDILCRELIEAGQDEESQKAHADEDGKEVGSFLCLFEGLDF